MGLPHSPMLARKSHPAGSPSHAPAEENNLKCSRDHSGKSQGLRGTKAWDMSFLHYIHRYFKNQ